MAAHIILASGSETRASMLRNAGLVFDIERPRVDEEAAKAGLLAEQARPRHRGRRRLGARSVEIALGPRGEDRADTRSVASRADTRSVASA